MLDKFGYLGVWKEVWDDCEGELFMKGGVWNKYGILGDILKYESWNN